MPIPSAVPAHSATSARGPGDLQIPCPGCGYDLRGAASDRCSECGRVFDRAELESAAEIPWQHRRQVGRVRAFWRTLKLAMLRPRRLAEQVGREVDYRSARRFQYVACAFGWIALAPFAVVLFIAYRGLVLWPWTLFGSGGPAPGWQWAVALLLDGLVLAAALAGLYVWLITATGVISYFFHPSGEEPRTQRSAVALSYYASAPVALLPLATVMVAAMTPAFLVAAYAPEVPGYDGGLMGPVERLWLTACGLLALCVVLLVGVMLLAIPWVMMRRGLRRSAGRAAAMLATAVLAAPVLFVLWVIVPGLLVVWIEAVVLMMLW